MENNIYGVSSKFNFGKWNHQLYIFTNDKDANKWLNTDERNFCERELMDRKQAISLVGRKMVLVEENK